MSVVTLSLAKQHIAVTHIADDVLIQQCIDAAEAYAARFMGYESLDELAAVDSEQPSAGAVLPADVVRAVLLLAADYYNLREAQVLGTSITKNPAAENLLHFHRKGLGV